jgi:hypothetical protein
MNAWWTIGIALFLGICTGPAVWGADVGRPAASARQSTTVYRNATLEEDTVWRGDVRVEGGLTIARQATLTVTPGTMVSFSAVEAAAGSSRPALLVLGRLLAQGSPDQPVTFSGSGREAETVSWQGILLVGSEKNNLLEHVRIKGAMVGIDALFSRLTIKSVWADRCGTGVKAQDALLEAVGGVYAGCGIGLHLIDTEAALRGLQVQRNRQGIVSRRGSMSLQDADLTANEQEGIVVIGSRLALERTTILQNSIGLQVENGEGVVTGNRIAQQRGAGVVLTNARVRFRENTVTGNGASGLVVRDGRGVAYGNSLFANATFDLQNDGQEEFRAPGNWWGGDPVQGMRLGGSGPVIVSPFLQQAPSAQSP